MDRTTTPAAVKHHDAQRLHSGIAGTRLPAETYEALYRIAAKRRQSVSAVLRRLVELAVSGRLQF